MNTIQLIEQFLVENNIKLSARDFVETVSNIYHKHESQQYDDSHFSIELAIPYWKKTLLDLEVQLNGKKDLQVLDFGCGTGFATEQILNSNFKKACSQLVCYDLSPDMIDVCKEKFKSVPNISYLSNREGFENLKNKSGKFDVIVCNSLIHHILDHQLLFDVFEESLTENGILIIGHEPNTNFYNNIVLKRISQSYRVYKKLLNKTKSIFGVKKKYTKENDKHALTYNELLEKGYISKSFPDYLIQKFVDIHVPMSTLKIQPWGELGFNAAFFSAISSNKFQVIQQLSYNHIKDEQAYKSFFWKSISKLMQKRYPNDGADAIFVLKKTYVSK
jgi:2-polyprenyl-3-methyl-5-hydroxy-6-metoxy-1,4-benzoquinol methylase